MDKPIREDRSNLAIRPDTHKRIKDIAYSMGATLDEALNAILDAITQEGENDFDIGKRLKAEKQEKVT